MPRWSVTPSLLCFLAVWVLLAEKPLADVHFTVKHVGLDVQVYASGSINLDSFPTGWNGCSDNSSTDICRTMFEFNTVILPSALAYVQANNFPWPLLPETDFGLISVGTIGSPLGSDCDLMGLPPYEAYCAAFYVLTRVDSENPPSEGIQNVLGPGGVLATAASWSGDAIGFGVSGPDIQGGHYPYFYVPYGYVSDAFIEGYATYPQTSVTQLGLRAGNYEWHWGEGVSAESVTLTIEAPPPDNSTPEGRFRLLLDSVQDARGIGSD